MIVACAMFMAQLDGAVVTLLLPVMAQSFHSTALEVSTGITTYLLVQVALLPASGWIADRVGARRVFTLAIVCFTVASLLCALSRSLPEFVAARILQGGAAAFMSPVGRVLLLHSTSKDDLLRVINISTIPMLLAPTLGPVLGASFASYLSWPWIFLVNIPIGIAGVALTLAFIPRSKPSPRIPFDLVGFLLFGGSLTLGIYAMELLSKTGHRWQSPVTILISACLLGVAAVIHARRCPNPILSWSAVKIPTYFVGTLSGGAVVRVPLRALAFVLPLMFQIALGFSIIQSGLLLMVMSGSDLVLKSVTTRTLRRFGFRRVLIASAALSSVTIFAYALLSRATPTFAVVGCLIAGGALRSLLFSGVNALALADVPRKDISSASVLWNVMQQATNSVAVLLSVIVLRTSATLAGELHGQLRLQDFRTTLAIMAVIALCSLPSFWKMEPGAGAKLSGHGDAHV